jgi:DNA-directed RNA polymerase specialized sigma24 family protein
LLVLRRARVVDPNLPGGEVDLTPLQRQHLGVDAPTRHVLEFGDVSQRSIELVTHLDEVAVLEEPLPRLRGLLQLRDVRAADDLVVLPRQAEHAAEHGGLLDEQGKPLDDRLLSVLSRLLPRFRRRFPALRDEVEIAEVFEEAARRIAKKEDRSGPLESLWGYAWSALESVGVSWERRGETQVRFRSVESPTGPEMVAHLLARDGSAEQIEQDILLREFEAHMTPEDAWIFRQKALGFSSEDIAKVRGCSVNSVDKVMSRLKQKIRALGGVKQ